MTTEFPAITGSLDILEFNDSYVVKPPSKSSSLSVFSGVAIATLFSRITGFVRTLLVGIVLAVPAIRSAFSTANSLPNQVAALALDAVLASVVVPVLVRAEQEDPDGGKKFFNRLFSVSTVVLVTALVISLLLVPVIIPLLTSGQGDSATGEKFAYLLLPQIVFYGLTSLFSAALNVHGKYQAGAWAPVLNNVIAISALVAYALIPGDITSWPRIIVLCGGTTLGVLVQALILLPALYKTNFFPRWQFGIDSRLKQFGNLALAIVCYVGISQLGLYLTLPLASQASSNGPYTYFTAWSFLQVPYGVLGLTILTTMMPRFSQSAASHSFAKLRNQYRSASLTTVLLLVPATAFLTIFGTPICQIFFGPHSVNAHDVGQAVSWSAITLVPYAFVLLQLRIFYALNSAWIPTFIIIVITAVRLALNWVGVLRYRGNDVVSWLGLSNGLSFLVGALVGGSLLRSLLRGPSMRKGDIPVFWFTLFLSFILTTIAFFACYFFHISSTSYFFVNAFLIALAGIVLVPLFFAIILFSGIYRHIYEEPTLYRLVAVIDSLLAKTHVPQRLRSIITHKLRSSLKISEPPSRAAEAGSSQSQQVRVNKPTPKAAENEEPFLSDYVLQENMGGEQLGVSMWTAKSHKLNRAVTLIGSPQGSQIAERLINLGQIESVSVVKVFDSISLTPEELSLSTTPNLDHYTVTQWISDINLYEAALTKPTVAQICSSLEGLALTINYAHAQDVTLGLADPLCVRFTHSGKSILILPVPAEKTKAADIRGLASVFYTLVTGCWPVNPYPNHPWGDAIPLAATSYKKLPAMSKFNSMVDNATEATIVSALEFPDNPQHAIDLISMIIDNAARDTAKGVWLMNDADVESQPRFSAPHRKHNNSVHLSRALLAILGVVALFFIVISFSVKDWGNKNTQESISELYPPTHTRAPQNVAFSVKGLVDFTGNPNTLDKEHADNLPHMVTGQKPAWASDTYKTATLSTVKKPSDGLGIVIAVKNSTPHGQVPISTVTVFSPSTDARFSVYSYSDNAKQLSDLTQLHDEVTVSNSPTIVHLDKPYLGKNLLIWITHLSQTSSSYDITIDKIILQK